MRPPPTPPGRLVQRYTRKPEPVDATAPITAGNAADVAAWCGGRAHFDAKPSDPSDVSVTVAVPHIDGTLTARTGQRIVRDERGAFSVVNNAAFDAAYVHAQFTQHGHPGTIHYRGGGPVDTSAGEAQPTVNAGTGDDDLGGARG